MPNRRRHNKHGFLLVIMAQSDLLINITDSTYSSGMIGMYCGWAADPNGTTYDYRVDTAGTIEFNMYGLYRGSKQPVQLVAET